VAGVRGAPDAEARETIVRVVVELLEAEGDDRVRLAEVARRARVSLARVYKLFGTRDELVVAAVERWMAEHAYAPLAATVPSGDRYEDLRAVLRAVFQPWERTPTMLRAFHRARSGRGGDRLVAQATTAIRPAVRAALEGADPEYVADVEIVLLNVFYAVFGRFADGDLPITEVLPTLERVAFRLTADNRPSVVGTRAARPS
jgi:TetR/AcrR family transcriptional regulator, cholesterol catabolism regulator